VTGRGDKNEDRGISCPMCGCRHFYTTHTEPLRDGRVRRRKVCRYCGRKILTFESVTGRLARGDHGGRTGLDTPAG
jgi:DNA-directed RNA polymerase subunit RPC12/RpoP